MDNQRTTYCGLSLLGMFAEMLEEQRQVLSALSKYWVGILPTTVYPEFYHCFTQALNSGGHTITQATTAFHSNL
jgi:hypothetical protein